MDAVENVDPSKLSLKERIKFFASKSNKQTAIPEKPLSPTRAALASSSLRSTRSLSNSLMNASIAKPVANGIPTMFVRGGDKELADELVGESRDGGGSGSQTTIVTLQGGSTLGLGVRVEKRDAGVIVMGIDPEGAAGRAGVMGGWIMTDMELGGVNSGCSESVSLDGVDEEGLFSRVAAAVAAMESGRVLRVNFKPPVQ